MYQIADQSPPKVSIVRWLALLLVVGGSAFVAFRGLSLDGHDLVRYLAGGLSRAVTAFVQDYDPASAYFWGPLLAIVIAERLVPADRKQRILSPGLLVDLFWFISGPIFVVFLVSRLRGYMGSVYDNHFAFLTVETLRGLPLWLQVVIVILASDFLSWFSHLLRHKVKLFWHFHSIHHSQRELNAFTDHRVHPVEVLISVVIRFLPMTLLELRHGVALGVAWAFFTTWYTMVYHANIKSNYGWLRYVFVTPQSHRVHHSVLPEHQDKNFGTIFSFWDFMFGTQYRHFDEYPDVGVADPESPTGDSMNPLSAARTFVAQLVYPFKLIVKKGI